MTKIQAGFAIMICSVIWGFSIPLRQLMLDSGLSLGVVIFIPCLLFVMLCLVCFRKQIFRITKSEWKIGMRIGVLSAAANVLQTTSLLYTTPSNTAFITVTNVVMVPFITWIFFGQKPKKATLAAIAVCIFGMAIITGLWKNGLALNLGDFLTLLGALFMAIMLALLSNVPGEMDDRKTVFMVALSQLFGSVVVLALAGEAGVKSTNPVLAVFGIIYLSVFVMLVAYSLQCKAQKFLEAAQTSIIITLECVFASVFSIAMGLESFRLPMLVGGSMIVLSVTMLQIRWKTGKT